MSGGYEKMNNAVDDVADVAPTRARFEQSRKASTNNEQRESQFSTVDLNHRDSMVEGSVAIGVDSRTRSNGNGAGHDSQDIDSVEVDIDENGQECPKKKKVAYDSFPSYADSPGDLTPRERLRYFLEHLVFRAFSLFIILVDCVLLIIDVSTSDKAEHEQLVFDHVAMIFVSYFLIELALRVYALGIVPFFVPWYNKLDFVVIVLSFIVTLVYTVVTEVTVDGLVKLVVFGRLVRVIVLIRLIRVVASEPKNIQRGIRHAVSENKRRLRDGQFDLDMTYITKNVIGMSFPSSGKMAIYRNNIKDVAKYLDTVHGPGHYKVYNLCSEKSYDVTYFHNSVGRYSIDDHNVPTLQQMIEFAKDVKAFLEQDDKNVIAVHCKGGKGRTGTMICAWLIFNGQFNDSKDVLEYFGEQRTDKTIGSKYQGVETPSQARYVEYFNKVLNQLDGHIPEKVRVVLKKIKITSLIGVGVGNGSDLSCSMSIDHETTFVMDFGAHTNCDTEYAPEQDVLTISPRNCPLLIGDVRLKFNCKSKTVPKAYEDCAFYFWFNTTFVDMNKEGVSERTLTIKREDLDNPHKSKTWKIYRDKFAVQLFFNKIGES